MKFIYKKLILFTLPILFIISCIEIFYRYVENDYSKKNKDVKKFYKNAEVVVFGNSHPFYGVNPSYLDNKTYNFSLISQTLYYDKLLFDKHINKFQTLKCVIIHIEYTTLAELVETKENNWRKYYYKHYLDVSIPNNSIFDLRNYMISFTRGFKPNIELLQKFVKDNQIINCLDNGFGFNYEDYSDERLTEQRIKKRASAIEDGLMDFDKNLIILYDIIEYCKSRNIKVLFLTLPNTKKFYDLLDVQKRDKMFKTLTNLDNLNQNVYYLNMIQHKDFDYFDFYDADHLNHGGARKASLIINEKLHEIL